MIENRIKGVESNENSVYIMFRPTHIVILFAVFLCANAFPAAQESPGIQSAPGALTAGQLQIGPEETNPSLVQSTPTREGDGGSNKGDLDTDATSYWGYKYYGPRWGYGPGYGGRSVGWGFGLNREYQYGPYAWY